MARSEKETYVILREKHREALDVLYERYGKKLYSYGVNSWKLNEDDCWDIVYQTLEKVIKKAAEYEFESEKKFGSFLFTIFTNFLRNHYRDRKKREERLKLMSFNESLFEESAKDGSLQTERKVQQKIFANSITEYYSGDEQVNTLMDMLEEAMEELEDWERILLLQRSQDMAYKDIAKFIDKPEKQLKVYHQRAKKKLTLILKDKVIGIKGIAS